MLIPNIKNIIIAQDDEGNQVRLTVIGDGVSISIINTEKIKDSYGL